MGEMRFMLDNPLIITDGWAEREQEKAKFLGALLKASERINREDKEAAESLKKLLQGVPKGVESSEFTKRLVTDNTGT